MNILIFGNKSETEAFADLLESTPHLFFRQKAYSCYDNYDSFIEKLKATDCDVVFIIADGAMGMEVVNASKSMKPRTPVVWFSNDKDFGSQSYRLGVEFFGVKPITNRLIATALKRINLI